GINPLVGVEGAVRAVAARDLAGDLRRQVVGAETRDGAGAGLAGQQRRPAFLDAAGQRCNQPQPGDDYSAHARCLNQEALALSIYFTASPTVTMDSAASSGISMPNSSSNAMTSSTVSRLSAPRSSMK